MKDSDDEAEGLVLESIDKIGNFYRGTICKLHRSPERGKVHTATGREIPFTFAHVTMAGTRRRFEDLREGLQVGYDLGWTSKGVRVHLIWIPDEPGVRPPSEWKGGSEEDEAAHHLADENSEDGDVE